MRSDPGQSILIPDTDGNPIDKVYVTFKNEEYGTLTDYSCSYSLMGSAEAKILVYVAKGYLTKEEVINKRSAIDVKLECDPNATSPPSKAKKTDKQKKSQTPRQ